MDLNVAQKRGLVVAFSVTPPKGQRKRKTQKRAYIPRRTRRFQLRNNHPQDMHVAQILDYARSNKREVTVIRDAVELYYALEQGDMSVLFDKFPQYKAQFDIAGQVAQLMKAQASLPVTPLAAAPQSLAAGKALGFGKVIAPPEDDDDALPSIPVRASQQDCGANFLNGLRTLQ